MRLLTELFSYHYAYPWVALVPILGLFIFLFQRKEAVAVLSPHIGVYSSLPVSWRVRLRTPVLGLLGTVFICCLLISAARPQKITIMQLPEESRNILLALDISRSMSARDFRAGSGYASRLDAVKEVVSEFVKSRPYDRIGLVVFGSQAYLQAPLTLDHPIIEQILKRLRVGLAGDGTAIGDGLGLSVKRIESFKGDSRSIVLLTDGVSNSGKVNPLKAAKVAKNLGIKVHTIGIGSNQPVSLQLGRGFFGGRSVNRVEYDEITLKEIADITGGVFFNASSLEGLSDVYQEIDKLETTSREEPTRERIEEFFAKYLSISLIAYLSYLALSTTIFSRIP